MQLASKLKEAADETLNLNEMENIEGGGSLMDVKCVNNNVAGCACTIAQPEDDMLNPELVFIVKSNKFVIILCHSQ